jgi:hypothetical protein
MPTSERRKGLRGQQEVQRLFAKLGITLDKLAAQGDRIWRTESGVTIRVEVKRQERARLWEWIEQAEAETPDGMVPVVVFRKSGGEWYAVLSLADLVMIEDG